MFDDPVQEKQLGFAVNYGRPNLPQVEALLEEADAMSTRVAPDDVLLTVSEVAQILRLSPKTVETRMRSGSIPGFQVAGRWRASRTRIRSWLQELSDGS